jgi:hypothetical protein
MPDYFDMSNLPPSQIESSVARTNAKILSKMSEAARQEKLDNLPDRARALTQIELARLSEPTPTPTTVPIVLNNNNIALSGDALNAVRVIQDGAVRSFSNQSATVSVDANTRFISVALDTDHDGQKDDVYFTMQQNGMTTIVANGNEVRLSLPHAQRVRMIVDSLLSNNTANLQHVDLDAIGSTINDIAQRNAPARAREGYQPI